MSDDLASLWPPVIFSLVFDSGALDFQMDLRCAFGQPRVARKIRTDDFRHVHFAQFAERIDIQRQMPGPKWRVVIHPESKQARGRPQPASVLGVIRPQELFAQVNKRSGDLDQPLVKDKIAVRRTGPEPQMLQNVVGFVITPLVETSEIPLVAGMQSQIRVRLQGSDKGGHPLVLAH